MPNTGGTQEENFGDRNSGVTLEIQRWQTLWKIQSWLLNKTRGLIYKTLCRFHPKSVCTHKRSLLHAHKSFQIYKTMRTPEPVQKSLYKSRSGEDTCISTPSPPRNHHIWSLQRLVLLCITSSAYHFHAYSHPCDTMFNTVKGTSYMTLRKYALRTINAICAKHKFLLLKIIQYPYVLE